MGIALMVEKAVPRTTAMTKGWRLFPLDSDLLILCILQSSRTGNDSPLIIRTTARKNLARFAPTCEKSSRLSADLVNGPHRWVYSASSRFTRTPMPTVVLAPSLVRYLPCSAPGPWSRRVEGRTVREAIEAVLVEVPVLRGYLLDEHGAMRHHIAAFVNGVVIRDKVGLAEPIPGDGELFLVPALSGG